MFTELVSYEDCWSSVRDNVYRLRALAFDHEMLTDGHLSRLVASSPDGPQRALMRVMLDPVQRAERRCAYASGPALRSLVRHLEKLITLPREEQLATAEKNRREVESVCSSMIASARIPTRSEMESVLLRLTGNDKIAGMIWSIVDIGGLDGKFTFVVGKTRDTVVESTLGYNFTLHSPLADMGEWKRRDARVLIVDGTIEFVHELHHVLEAASSARIPLVLAARSFGDEVLSTLRLNRRRGTLDIHPIIIPLELEHVNTPKDLAVVTGSEIISSTLGQLVSSVKVSELPEVDEITHSFDTLTISNSKRSSIAEFHRSELVKKRSIVEAESSHLYEGRIKSLSPNHTVIKLPATYDSLSVRSDSQLVANGLRLIRAMHEAGVVDTPEGQDVTLRLVIGERFAVSQASLIASLACALFNC